MKHICAWCKKSLGASKSDNSNIITHGICKDCATKVLNQGGISLNEFIDSIDAPILYMESSSKVISANKNALKVLGKEQKEIEHKAQGDVLECIYAKQDGGCGKHDHCKSCAIRFAVMNTLSTGKSILKIQSHSDIQQFDKIKKLKFLISTEKFGQFVLLRIDDITEIESIT